MTWRTVPLGSVSRVTAPVYVALGSSMAAGPGIPPYANRAAGRSRRNYPSLVAARCGYQLVDATVSGATTDTVLHAPQQVMGSTFPPQVDQLTADAALVTITVGGNDLGYVGTMMALSLLAPLGLVPRRLLPDRLAPSFDRTQADIDRVEAALGDVVEAVRTRAPQARVLLVDYLTLLGSSEPSFHALPLRARDRQACRALADELAGCFARVAASAGVTLVSASTASVDHGIGSPEPWVVGFDFGNPLRRQLKVPYHPNARGMEAVAELVVQGLR
jgi:lysophospholipase L1-like esterase